MIDMKDSECEIEYDEEPKDNSTYNFYQAQEFLAS